MYEFYRIKEPDTWRTPLELWVWQQTYGGGTFKGTENSSVGSY